MGNFYYIQVMMSRLQLEMMHANMAPEFNMGSVS
jgi:hypothetical protein